jgi:hypothetical protein
MAFPTLGVGTRAVPGEAFLAGEPEAVGECSPTRDGGLGRLLADRWHRKFRLHLGHRQFLFVLHRGEAGGRAFEGRPLERASREPPRGHDPLRGRRPPARARTVGAAVLEALPGAGRALGQYRGAVGDRSPEFEDEVSGRSARHLLGRWRRSQPSRDAGAARQRRGRPGARESGRRVCPLLPCLGDIRSACSDRNPGRRPRARRSPGFPLGVPAPAIGSSVALCAKWRESLRVLPLLVAILFSTSCVVPPSCFRWTYGFSAPRIEHFATISVRSEAGEVPRWKTRSGTPERFDRGSIIIIDASGSMMVTDLMSWPESCPRIPPSDLAEVSRIWQPILERAPKDQTRLEVGHLYRDDDGRAHGPFISLSFGATSGRTIGLLWDGQRSLPEDLDTAVFAILESACSNSRLARKYLLRDLPQQVANRLEC